MKIPLVPWLVVSLAGNAVLAFVVLRGPAPVALAPAVPALAPVASPAAAGKTTAPAPAPVNWQTLKPDQDLHTLVAHLRSTGFPPGVIRAVLSHLIAERSNIGALDHLPFWKQNPNNPEFVAAQQEQMNRRREMLKDLLGDDARPSVTMDPAARERRFGSLPDDKVDQIEALVQDYGQLRMKLMAERKSGDMSGTMAAQFAAEQEQHKELASILTPTELEQYEMRNSLSANKTMSAVKDLDLTEAEYAGLFRAQQAFDNNDPLRAGTMSPDGIVQRNAAQDVLNEQARAVLTDDRFYTYLQGADPAYARNAKFMADYPAVPPATTYELTRMEREFQTQGIAMMRNGSPMDHMAEAMALRNDFQNKVNALLGPEAGAAFLQRNRLGGGSAPARRAPGGG
ncbi:MAG TPA: hypothetical protein VL200_13375 [Lacunisphaera sp.]|jgi:hypothetical protein|nr:hypothetical protein [Lacunisphaera sp.]